MTAREKYDEIFRRIFLLPNSESLTDKDVLNVESWDSIEHMTFICELEGAFGISVPDDEIMNLSSYQRGIELLKKCGIKL